jgi:hypothetical protein
MEVRQSVRALGWLPLVCALVLLGHAPAALAKANGLPTTGCESCHMGGRAPTVTITMDPLIVQPGGTATLTVKVSTPNGGPAGFYLHSRGQGTFMEIAGEGTRLPTPSEVTHAQPKRGGDPVSFQVRWQAPNMRGAYSFEAAGVSANGNNQPSGDAAGHAILPFTIGCEGIDVYVDLDGDGYGSSSIPPTKACDVLPGFATKGGDCLDYRADVHPGATEVCNEFDDNCDGKVNEGLGPVLLYRDADGDGHGARYTMDTKMGCNEPGYVAKNDDCDDNDKSVYPGAKEVCNNKDDNCNGRVDEGAKVTCGVGWCRATAESCNSTACTPGTPRPEECNLVDDDCDGMIDNNARCDPGRVCVLGRCLTTDDAAKIAAMNPTPDGGAALDGGPTPSPSPATSPPAQQGGAIKKKQAGALGCGYVPARGGLGLGLLALLALVGLLRRR